MFLWHINYCRLSNANSGLFIYIVTWSPIEKGEIRLLLFLVLELASRQRLTVKRETKNWVNFSWSLKEEKKCGSSYLYSVTWLGWQIVALTNRLTREKKREAKWLTGALGRKWELLPSAEVGRKKVSPGSDIVVTRLGEAHAKTPGKEKRKYLGQERKGTLLSSQTPKIK